MKQNQQGFSTGMVIAIVAVVVVIGVIAWRLIDMNSTNTNNTQPTGVTDQPTTPAEDTTEETGSTTTTGSNAGYLVISQWNVRFKPESGVGSLQYKIDGTFAEFTSAELVAADSACEENALGAIGRSATSPDADTPGISDIKKIGDYYYWFASPQSACSDKESVMSILESGVVNKFKQSYLTIEAAAQQ